MRKSWVLFGIPVDLKTASKRLKSVYLLSSYGGFTLEVLNKPV
jgi:hypothetical protein